MYVCMFWFEYGRHEEARFFFFLSFLVLFLSCSLSLFSAYWEMGLYVEVVYSCCEEYPALKKKKKRELEIEISENDDPGDADTTLRWLG